MAAITAFGSLVPAGNTLNLRQNSDEWQVRPTLWTAIIGDPGTNKSAVVNAAVRGPRAVEAAWRSEYAKAKRAYDLRQAAQPKQQKPASDPFDVDDVPAPKYRQKITNDATTESLASVLAENPHGILGFFEELSGLFGGMDAYKPRGGKDRPFWLQAKDGGPLTINRKTSGRTYVPTCAVSVLGTIQPDKLRSMAPGLVDDGFLQRFMLVFICRTGDGQDIPTNAALELAIVDIATAMVDVPDEAKFRLSPEAMVELHAIQALKNREIDRLDNPPALRQWLDKLPNEFGRLSLVFHHIDWASGVGPKIDDGPPETVPGEAATKARRLIEEFLYPHARAVYAGLLLGDQHEGHGRWIAGFILSRRLDSINERDIYRSYPALRPTGKHGDIPVIMRTLEMLDWVRPVKFKGSVATAWKVNPPVHDGRFANVARAEIERRGAVRENIKRTAERRPARISVRPLG